MDDDPTFQPLDPKARAYCAKRYSCFARLLADTEFCELFLTDYLEHGIREATIKEQGKLRGVELERSAARLTLVDEIRGHLAACVRQHELFMQAERDAAQRQSSGLPPAHDD